MKIMKKTALLTILSSLTMFSSANAVNLYHINEKGLNLHVDLYGSLRVRTSTVIDLNIDDPKIELFNVENGSSRVGFKAYARPSEMGGFSMLGQYEAGIKLNSTGADFSTRLGFVGFGFGNHDNPAVIGIHSITMGQQWDLTSDLDFYDQSFAGGGDASQESTLYFNDRNPESLSYSADDFILKGLKLNVSYALKGSTKLPGSFQDKITEDRKSMITTSITRNNALSTAFLYSPQLFGQTFHIGAGYTSQDMNILTKTQTVESSKAGLITTEKTDTRNNSTLTGSFGMDLFDRFFVGGMYKKATSATKYEHATEAQTRYMTGYGAGLRYDVFKNDQYKASFYSTYDLLMPSSEKANPAIDNDKEYTITAGTSLKYGGKVNGLIFFESIFSTTIDKDPVAPEVKKSNQKYVIGARMNF